MNTEMTDMTWTQDDKQYEFVTVPDLSSPLQCSQGCAFNTDTAKCPSDIYGYTYCDNDINKIWKEIKILKSPTQEVKEFEVQQQEVKGTKYDSGKTQWWYLPIEPIKEVLAVLEYGDKKYPDANGTNWKHVPNAKKRYYSAAMRHLTAWFEGEKNDPETNRSHLAHACTNVLFLLWFEIKGKFNE
jgi:hypothetical protein